MIGRASRKVKTLIRASVERVETGSVVVGEAGKTGRDIVANAARPSRAMAYFELPCAVSPGAASP